MADEASKEKKEETPTYHRDRLIAEANAFFGQPSHVVVGGLSMGRNAAKVNFSRPEAEKAIEAFLDHEVALDHQRREEG